MATFEHWVRTANDSPAIVSIFGSAVTAGGGAGTELSPWSAWASVNSKVIETSHAADDLIINFHPASYFLIGATATLQQWSNLGYGTSWRSILFRRWTAIDADARWLPFQAGTINGLQELLSGAWTQGSVSGGVWSAGTGDVYRAQVLTSVGAGDHTYFRAYAGVDMKDTRANRPTVLVYCQALSDMVAEGDHSLAIISGSDYYLYVKTGAVGVNPSARWGGNVAYANLSGNGRNALLMYGPKNITITDCFQSVGTKCSIRTQNSGEYIDNVTWNRPRGRGQITNGLWLDTGANVDDTICRNVTFIEPDLDAWEMPRRIRATTLTTSSSATNGMYISGKITNLLITNPKISGYSHAQFGIEGAKSHFFSATRNVSAADQWVQWTRWGDIALSDAAVYVGGDNDQFGTHPLWGVRSIWITITGTFSATVTLQSGPSSTGPWTDVKTWTAAVDEGYNDGLSTGIYYRLGVKAANYTSGTPVVTLRAATWPRNVEVRVTDYSDGKSTLTGAVSTADTTVDSNYQRGFGAGGVNVQIGPLKIVNQTTQSQVSGDVTLRGTYWDASCKAYSDNSGGASNYNVGHHLSGGDFGPWGYVYPRASIRAFGTKHDLVGGLAFYWGTLFADYIEFNGAVVRDAGHARFYPQAVDLTQAAYTRRRTPFHTYTPSGGQPGYQSFKNIKAILNAACEGLVAVRRFGVGSEIANATSASHPAVAVGASVSSEDAFINFGASRLSGNVAGTAAGFGFDENLNYIGQRVTPVQTSPRRGRGYL